MSKTEVGSMTWFDLTVPNAKQVSDFYSSVVGWQKSPVNMGDYDDFAMLTSDTDTAVSGVCHATGVNQDLPAQWLMYIKVADLNTSIAQVVKLGGSVLTPVKKLSEMPIPSHQRPGNPSRSSRINLSCFGDPSATYTRSGWAWASPSRIRAISAGSLSKPIGGQDVPATRSPGYCSTKRSAACWAVPGVPPMK